MHGIANENPSRPRRGFILSPQRWKNRQGRITRSRQQSQLRSIATSNAAARGDHGDLMPAVQLAEESRSRVVPVQDRY